MKYLLIALLKGYKKYISPLLGHHCRFLPTCSVYAMQALEIHGLFKGLALTLWRLLRCNPLCKFGYDPVPEKGRWQNPAARLTREGRPPEDEGEDEGENPEKTPNNTTPEDDKNKNFQQQEQQG